MSHWDRIVALGGELLGVLRGRGLTLAVAESCTGGLLSASITANGGSSDSFLGGVVAYANQAKEALLGVSPGTLVEFGAVSGECALEMALGCARAFGARCSVSVTGVAGPTGGSVAKPVGTVWFCFAVDGDARCEVMRFQGDRRQVQMASVEHALKGLMEALS
ncbi:CinA family protein [Thermanaerovibrio acidaminovorans]|uniref:CinA domain protein n=1 Tax=Thermanaerovibrio acidaminovorans (strain ATCC 49978 / DSM 6589 / Su883) TaxID=525903 RepID=D1B783_THEAS|nr:CinA family protein [Thermanaerovibrio acidaminovorans]ACZ19874.1 CinA domain protein [Thermanaerovibrio acidaminovorans DSM 6589]